MSAAGFELACEMTATLRQLVRNEHARLRSLQSDTARIAATPQRAAVLSAVDTLATHSHAAERVRTAALLLKSAAASSDALRAYAAVLAYADWRATLGAQRPEWNDAERAEMAAEHAALLRDAAELHAEHAERAARAARVAAVRASDAAQFAQQHAAERAEMSR